MFVVLDLWIRCDFKGIFFFLLLSVTSPALYKILRNCNLRVEKNLENFAEFKTWWSNNCGVVRLFSIFFYRFWWDMNKWIIILKLNNQSTGRAYYLFSTLIINWYVSNRVFARFQQAADCYIDHYLKIFPIFFSFLGSCPILWKLLPVSFFPNGQNRRIKCMSRSRSDAGQLLRHQ